MIAVAAEPPESLQAWNRYFNGKVRFLADPDLHVIQQFGLRHGGAGPDGIDAARPATFVLDAGGVIRWRHVAEHVLDRPDPALVAEALAAIAGK